MMGRPGLGRRELFKLLKWGEVEDHLTGIKERNHLPWVEQMGGSREEKKGSEKIVSRKRGKRNVQDRPVSFSRPAAAEEKKVGNSKE